LKIHFTTMKQISCPLVKSLFLFLFSVSSLLSASAKTVVIGSGSGTVSQTSMTGLSAGDVLAIKPGTYNGGTFSNLTNITITNNGGVVTFTGSNYVEIGSGNTNLTITGLTFSNVQSDAFLLTGTNIQGLYIYHCTFSKVTDYIIDAGGYAGAYTGTISTLKVYRFALDNCKFTNCGSVWQGFYGTPSQNTGLCDSVEMGYDTVINTATNGTEVAGPISHLNAHHWMITYSGLNSIVGDVGVFQTAGDGQIHDCYYKGGRGYLCRQLMYGLNGVGAFYFYNNIIYGQNAYGGIDIRCDPSNYGATNPYLTKANAWLYNCTMGNKTDVNGYVCPVAIVGVMGSGTGNATCTIRNMFAFNNQYGANPIANNNANGTWAVDTANDVYSDAAHALLYLQDTTTTFMPLANSYLNTKGVAMTTPHLPIPDMRGFTGSTNRIGAIFYSGSGGHSVTANAGANQTITLPTNAASLSGSSSTVVNSTISSYKWSEVSGPGTATLSAPTLVGTNATGLIAGTYVFSLKVKDAANDSSTATVAVTVNAANQPPVVSAGTNQNISLPTSSVTLTGTATDPSGISSYLWTQVSGPATATIAASNASATSVTGLVAGTYVFQLKVLDLLNLSAVATVSVIVNPATQKVVVSAGSNQSISMPTSSVILTGTATDASGTIKSYLWTQVSGPNTSSITNATSITTTITGLIVGTYVFQLKATDNNNVSGTATVSVTVTPSAVNIVSVSAGANQTITLPLNSVVLTATVTDSKLSNPSFTAWWSQTSGPSASSLATPYNAKTTITKLVAGTYVYNVSITDPNGSATATVSVTVNPAVKTAAFQSPVEVTHDTASTDIVAAVAKNILTDSSGLRSLSLYPNPATGTITFRIYNEAIGNMTINIYDMSGKMVMSKEYNKPSTYFSTSINLSSLYQGTYILQAIIAKQTATITKFVKL
jgi:K319-like protein/type IX secretion system substrate protein